MKKTLLSVLVAIGLGSPGVFAGSVNPYGAISPNAQLSPLVIAVERAILTQAAQFDEVHSFERIPAVTLAQELFPAYGLIPTTSSISWALQHKEGDIIRLCTAVPLKSAQDRIDASLAIARHDLRLTDGSCERESPFANNMMSADSPIIYLFKDINRRHAALPSKRQGEISVHVIANDKVANPFVLKSNPVAALATIPGHSSSPVMLWIQNTSTLEAMELIDAQIDPGWHFSNNYCGVILPGFGCSVEVSFLAGPKFSQEEAGRVQMTFQQVILTEAEDEEEEPYDETPPPDAQQETLSNPSNAQFSITLLAKPAFRTQSVSLLAPSTPLDLDEFEQSTLEPT